MKKRSNVLILCFVFALLLVVTACSSGTAAVPEVEAPETAEQEEAAEESEEEQAAPVSNGLAEEEIEIEFTTSDGRILTGTYYPAANLNAPVVVLMHWAMGEKTDWEQIAYWLQNRGLAGISENATEDMPWLDSSWFPSMPVDKSYNVFTFTFYNCEDGGCQTFEREKWLLDVQAAFETARTLEGVNSTKVVGIGASIGADGAADGCQYINFHFPYTCHGAISLSPGSYLTLNYKDVVDELIDIEPVGVLCFYATGDAESAQTCESIEVNENYTPVKYEGNYHGMMLIQPELEHDTLTMIMEFLDATVGWNEGY